MLWALSWQASWLGCGVHLGEGIVPPVYQMRVATVVACNRNEGTNNCCSQPLRAVTACSPLSLIRRIYKLYTLSKRIEVSSFGSPMNYKVRHSSGRFASQCHLSQPPLMELSCISPTHVLHSRAARPASRISCACRGRRDLAAPSCCAATPVPPPAAHFGAGSSAKPFATCRWKP